MQRMIDNLRQVIELRRREPKVCATDMLQLMLEAQAGAEVNQSISCVFNEQADLPKRVMPGDQHRMGCVFNQQADSPERVIPGGYHRPYLEVGVEENPHGASPSVEACHDTAPKVDEEIAEEFGAEGDEKAHDKRGGVGATENKAIVDEAIVVDAVAHVRANMSEPNPDSERKDRTKEETRKAEVEKPAADSREEEETKGGCCSARQEDQG
ncbi:hypothetical protein HPB52_024003 [Rhipicephalus sanguineus]|uniref:Uncharacterized protein n=1 Tax=Rhipicephalus sanguineus TaxID=34632 RepID=A0A9D4YR74_RHISA|nr:hypothetical protein HPB52_024003 [Rhipicephalus sanguineus]